MFLLYFCLLFISVQSLFLFRRPKTKQSVFRFLLVSNFSNTVWIWVLKLQIKSIDINISHYYHYITYSSRDFHSTRIRLRYLWIVLWIIFDWLCRLFFVIIHANSRLPICQRKSVDFVLLSVLWGAGCWNKFVAGNRMTWDQLKVLLGKSNCQTDWMYSVIGKVLIRIRVLKRHLILLLFAVEYYCKTEL